MNDTARDPMLYQPADTKGLEDLFEKQDHQDQVELVEPKSEFQVQDQMEPLEPNQQFQIHQVELIPLAEAAKRLGVTRRYASKLAVGGRLQAVQDNKGRWLVKLEQGQIQIIDQKDHVELPEPKSEFQKQDHQDHLELLEPNLEFQDQDHVELVQIQFQDQVILGYQQQIKELQNKLEAASFRVGYLQSQVEAKDQEIEIKAQQLKLLTDSQHKPSWWNKFKSWFLGAP